MTMKTKLSAGVLALAMMAGGAVAEEVKIGIAAEPYPPFSSLDASGNWIGWEIEIINAVCAAAEMDCVITPVAWDGIIPSLTGKQIDAIMASMSITEERMQTIDFSDKYYDTPTVIVADKAADIAPTAEGLAGKILGVQGSTVHQTYAQTHFADAGEIRVYQTQDEINQDLAAGRIDAAQADSIAMDEFVASEAGSCCEVKGAVENDTAILGLGVGAGVRKGDDALREQINKGIAAIRENGAYDEITKKYFSSSIYGS
ncbi:transporter substrate-binding domain-containing protein [Defluviimonas sp. D31]|uniref:transporter substrate-binding domain-containing protein n=1 Tax=Defluviimonas sp. D31 TaxID=3083253 RepID=UPI00296E6E61|nr:transporter substrate-binding domain-containing protein [Defluviimonas sp. D31]MDW4550603.1 transporter substrate-binding domain-containing protein [Defluviimonas sp. D31]